jgi:hypothetical protein
MPLEKKTLYRGVRRAHSLCTPNTILCSIVLELRAGTSNGMSQDAATYRC